MEKDISKRRYPNYNCFTYANQWRVGKPWMANLSASSFCSVASTLAIVRGGSKVARVAAAFSYSGVSFLQCPLYKYNACKWVATRQQACAWSLRYLPPWSVEFNKQVIVFGNGFIEVLVGKDKNTVVEDLLSSDEVEKAEGHGGKSL